MTHNKHYVYQKGTEIKENNTGFSRSKPISRDNSTKRMSPSKNDQKKTKEQLISELKELRQRIVELEKSEAE